MAAVRRHLGPALHRHGGQAQALHLDLGRAFQKDRPAQGRLQRSRITTLLLRGEIIEKGAGALAAVRDIGDFGKDGIGFGSGGVFERDAFWLVPLGERFKARKGRKIADPCARDIEIPNLDQAGQRGAIHDAGPPNPQGFQLCHMRQGSEIGDGGLRGKEGSKGAKTGKRRKVPHPCRVEEKVSQFR